MTQRRAACKGAPARRRDGTVGGACGARRGCHAAAIRGRAPGSALLYNFNCLVAPFICYSWIPRLSEKNWATFEQL